LNQVGIFTLKKASSLIWGNLTTTVVSGVAIFLYYKLKNETFIIEEMKKKINVQEQLPDEIQKLQQQKQEFSRTHQIEFGETTVREIKPDFAEDLVTDPSTTNDSLKRRISKFFKGIFEKT
ncbi:MAG: hypothetical protein JXA94_07325, partial [Parachlamydiales bacterium]|nr:hypothetical protein [Parachlamydiales bacterium]